MRKPRHIVKTNDTAWVWCIWCSSVMSVLAEMQVHMEPFWNDSRRSQEQVSKLVLPTHLIQAAWGTAVRCRRTCPSKHEVVSWHCSPDYLSERNVLTKIRAVMILCASTATDPEQARPSIWRHAWSPLTIQAVHSILCYLWVFASCCRGKRGERKFSLNIHTESLSMGILLLQYWSFFPSFLREFVLFL